MVFLTLRLLRFAPPHDRSWRKDMYRRLSWPDVVMDLGDDFLQGYKCETAGKDSQRGHFYGRRRNCNALSRTPIRRSLRFATWSRAPRRKHINNIFSYRIAAGCAEHGVQFSSFMKSLRESNIVLDKKILSYLAVCEPRSFQSLCELVKKRHSESVQAGLAVASQPTPSGVVTRDMISKARTR